jgi:hypothetical protein
MSENLTNPHSQRSAAQRSAAQVFDLKGEKFLRANSGAKLASRQAATRRGADGRNEGMRGQV